MQSEKRIAENAVVAELGEVIFGHNLNTTGDRVTQKDLVRLLVKQAWDIGVDKAKGVPNIRDVAKYEVNKLHDLMMVELEALEEDQASLNDDLRRVSSLLADAQEFLENTDLPELLARCQRNTTHSHVTNLLEVRAKLGNLLDNVNEML